MNSDGSSFTSASAYRKPNPTHPHYAKQAHVMPPHTLGLVLPPIDMHVATSASPGGASPSSPNHPPGEGSRSPSPSPALLAGGAPGTGINASPTAMIAPSPWKIARRRTMRARRNSADQVGRDLEQLLLAQKDSDQPPCEVSAQKVFEMVGSVPWFGRLSNTDLQQLLQRGSIAYFARGDTIVRESSYGSAFYVLLRGLVSVHSTERHIDVVLKPGQSFGEAALALQVHVRREASVSALEECWCFRMAATDLREMSALHEEMADLRRVYLAKLLGKVKWFDMLAAHKLEALGRIVEIESHAASHFVFTEGDPADKMYIVVSGSVGIFKEKSAAAPPASAELPVFSSAAPVSTPTGSDRGDERAREEEVAQAARAKTWADCNVLLAEFTPQSKHPWFGEAVFLEQKVRSATAFTLESTQLLSVHISQAAKLMELVPSFFKMNSSFGSVYQKTNQLNGTAASQPHAEAHSFTRSKRGSRFESPSPPVESPSRKPS